MPFSDLHKAVRDECDCVGMFDNFPAVRPLFDPSLSCGPVRSLNITVPYGLLHGLHSIHDSAFLWVEGLPGIADRQVIPLYFPGSFRFDL